LIVHRSEITIDLGALRRNIVRLRDVAAPAEVWAVVKADAYGHGAADVAPAALEAGATGICVATVAEGVALRPLVPEARIIVLGALTSGEVEPARAAGLEVVISDPDIPAGLRAHVKVDTGMGRWGMDAHRLSEVAPSRVAGLMSHLATADEPDDAFAHSQIDRFRDAAAGFAGVPLHLANSAATLRFPQARLDAVRCGIAVYGLSPFGDDPAAHGLAPMLSWRSYVAQVKTLQPAESTGYGRRFIAEEPTRIGVVPVGYGDGLRRGLAGVDVLVDGVRRRMLGTISMDAVAVALPEGEVGTPVTLIGDGILAEEHATALGTITYEIVCGIRSDPGRALRTVVDG
jgi:alanine racemase